MRFILKNIDLELAWKNNNFHSVVDLPKNYRVLDLTKNSWPSIDDEYCIGKYDEVRPNMYKTSIFGGIRNVHVGIDIGGPVGTPCRAFEKGIISNFGYNPEPGDYGFVVITEHKISGVSVWALYGHLNSKSVNGKEVGQVIEKGDIIAWFGNESENGGWAPHLHFQLSLIEPETHDLPGVVSAKDREKALTTYPDPRLVLGPIY